MRKFQWRFQKRFPQTVPFQVKETISILLGKPDGIKIGPPLSK